MTTLRIPVAQPLDVGHAPRARTVRTTVLAAGKWGQRALVALALTLFVTIALLPRLGLYRPVTVLSGSMRPTFSPGDMVIVTPEPVSSVRVGHVISYKMPVGVHQVETHRIVRVLQGGVHPVVQTRGDANNANDPWTAKLEGDTAWRHRVTIPKLGYVVNAFRSHTVQTAAVRVVPVLLALLVLWEIWGLGTRRSRPGATLSREAA